MLLDAALAKQAFAHLLPIHPPPATLDRAFDGTVFVMSERGIDYRASLQAGRPIGSADTNWVTASVSGSDSESFVNLTWEIQASQPSTAHFKREGTHTTSSLQLDAESKLYRVPVRLELTKVSTNRVLLVTTAGGAKTSQELTANFRTLSEELRRARNQSFKTVHGAVIELCEVQGQPFTVQVDAAGPRPESTRQPTARQYGFGNTPDFPVWTIMAGIVVLGVVIGGFVMLVVLLRKGGEARRKQIVFACVAMQFIVLSLLGVRYLNSRWEDAHWHADRVQWGGDSTNAAGVLRIAEVKREGRVVLFRIACESGQLPVNFQVSYSGQEIEPLPAAEAAPGVTALFAPATVNLPPGYSGLTLVGTRWERRMEKLTLQKPGEITLGFVLPDEARAEMAVQQAREIYPPGRLCHPPESTTLVLFSQIRNAGENNRESLDAWLIVDFAATPVRPAPATSKTSALSFGPVVERIIWPFDKNPSQACLDMGSGEFRSPPAAIADGIRLLADNNGQPFSDLNGAGDERHGWLKTSGVDLIGGLGRDSHAKFKYIGQPPHYETGWTSFDRADPAKVVQELQASPFAAGDKPNLPAIYINDINPQLESVKKAKFILFRTHDGDAGILQVLGENQNPPGVKIRYKLVQNQVTTATPVSMPPVAPSLARGPRLQFRLIAETNDPSAELLADHRGKQQFRVRREILLDDASVAETKVNDEGPNPIIDVTFSAVGGKRFAEITSANRGKQLVVIFDGKVFFAPVIQQSVTAGHAQIAGNFTLAEARAIKQALMAKAVPRFRALIACFNGKLDSGSACSSTNFQPDGTIHPKGKLTCGYPGKVSEIEWAFVEQRGDKDAYQFTRRFPADTAATATTTKIIEFSDRRVVVFEDEFQAVVIGPAL
ncbi:MAG: hypothetical protein EBS84_15935 [Proteobacteria bacterium]|nr:hypothetical protein [Verrucomicrobiota bacterium]NBU10481.1 hypothetical protein [Pseudomonadota bacterium]